MGKDCDMVQPVLKAQGAVHVLILITLLYGHTLMRVTFLFCR